MSKPSAKKKGLSIEEKVLKVEAWFHKHPSPYTLKELMALIPRATGVIFQSIEECVELLVSEGRVCQDKVGVHTLFWWFPTTDAQRQHQLSRQEAGTCATSSRTRQGVMDKVTEARAQLQAMSLCELEALCAELEATSSQLQAARESRLLAIGSPEDCQRDAAVQKALLQEKRVCQQRIDVLAMYDTGFLQTLQERTQMALSAANRWTDNFFLLEQHITSTMGLSAHEIRQSLNVPVDLDFIEALDHVAKPGNATAPALNGAVADAVVVREERTPVVDALCTVPALEPATVESPSAAVVPTPTLPEPVASTLHKRKSRGTKAAVKGTVVPAAPVDGGAAHVDIVSIAAGEKGADVPASRVRKRKRA